MTVNLDNLMVQTIVTDSLVQHLREAPALEDIVAENPEPITPNEVFQRTCNMTAEIIDRMNTHIKEMAAELIVLRGVVKVEGGEE